MSRLFILTRPALVSGYQLAGVDAYEAGEVETAQELIESWLAGNEEGLLAIDDGLLALLDPAVIRRLESCEHLPYLAIPGGKPLGSQASRRFRIAEMIRQAIGYHITFRGEEPQEKP